MISVVIEVATSVAGPAQLPHRGRRAGGTATGSTNADDVADRAYIYRWMGRNELARDVEQACLR